MDETLDIRELIKYPYQDNLKTLYNHLGRYYYAMKKLNITKDDEVLDIACGRGYGAYLLSQHAKTVFGSDINAEYLKFAEANFQTKNIIYLYPENGKATIPSTVNKIVCIETIEHMKENDIIEFLDTLTNACGPNAQLFMTFPVGKNMPSEYNPYHKCEPSVEFIRNIMKKSFARTDYEINRYVNNYNQLTEYCVMVCKEKI